MELIHFSPDLEWDLHLPRATTRTARIANPRTEASGVVKRVLRDLELAGVVNDEHYGGYIPGSDLAISVQNTVKQLFTAIRIDYGLLQTHDLAENHEAGEIQGASMMKTYIKVNHMPDII